MSGPLKGLRIIELAGIGPGPFCGMMLADHGAEVIRVDRLGSSALSPTDALTRSRKSICVDLKSPKGNELVRDLVKSADGLIEGFRPGVMERLGLGPEILLKDNPNLIYGRMTGWGQYGSLAHAAGHDINYIGVSGALHTSGRRGGQPTPAANYIGDFGGGAMFLAFGMVSALLGVNMGGKGQVIDCAMTDGSALLMGMTWSMYASGMWKDETGVNRLDTGAHFYDTYPTKDGKWVAIGSIEPQFYALLREKLGLVDDKDFDDQNNEEIWPILKEKMVKIFKTKTRDEWCALMEGTDVCFAPALSLAEAPKHPHNVERKTFLDIGGAYQPAPAPRYSDYNLDEPRPAPPAGENTDEILQGLGYDAARILALKSEKVV